MITLKLPLQRSPEAMPLSLDEQASEAAATQPPATAAGGRRNFLGLAICTPAAAAASVLGLGESGTGAAVEQVLPAAVPQAQEQRGYHLSPHIQTYYDSLRY